MTTQVTVHVPTLQELKAGWGALAEKKVNLLQSLAKSEMEMQGILNNAGNTITTIDSALALYRKKQTELIEERKAFTQYMDRVTNECMTAEKRTDPKTNAEYKVKEAELRSLRIKEDDTNKAAQQRGQEQQSFTAHCKNEFLRIESQWKTNVMQIANEHYTAALDVKEEDPTEIISLIKKRAAETSLPAPVKFEGTILSQEEKKSIHIALSSLAPRKSELVEWFNKWVEERFLMYPSDLASGTKADISIDVNEIQQQAELAQQINNFTATAEVPTFMTEGKAIKRVMKIVQEETQKFAQRVTFIFGRSPSMWDYLSKRSKWTTLSVAQMCEAISKYTTETGEQLPNVKYEEIVI